MQSGAQRPALRLLQCQDWCPSGMLTITFHVSSRYRLDYENHHQGKEERDSVDPLDTAGGLRLCR